MFSVAFLFVALGSLLVRIRVSAKIARRWVRGGFTGPTLLSGCSDVGIRTVGQIPDCRVHCRVGEDRKGGQQAAGRVCAGVIYWGSKTFTYMECKFTHVVA